MNNYVNFYVEFVDNAFCKVEKMIENKLTLDISKKYSLQEIGENVGLEVINNINFYFNLLGDDIQQFDCTEGFSPIGRNVGEYLYKLENNDNDEAMLIIKTK